MSQWSVCLCVCVNTLIRVENITPSVTRYLILSSHVVFVFPSHPVLYYYRIASVHPCSVLSHLDSVSKEHLLLVFLQAYFRQGVALQYLGRHADALAAFASGLAQDPKSLQLLVGMVEAAMKSPLRGGFT